MEASGEHLGLVLGTFTLVLVSGSNPSAGFLLSTCDVLLLLK